MKQWELRGVTDIVGESVRMPDRTGVAGIRDPDDTGWPGRGPDPLRVLVNQVPALFWTTDPDLVLTSSLGAELELLGLGPNQLVGTALADLVESGPSDLIEAHRQALEGSSVQVRTTWARRPFRARVAPLRDTEDRVIGTICVAIDEGEATPAARRALAGVVRSG